ncbi:MAG: aminoglycoside phosphotransferase family protein [Betaproteobacteria bacterium]
MAASRDGESLSAQTVAALRDAVLRHGGEPLPGGVSSDIQLVEFEGRRYCIKQALPRLKVQAEWRAPVERNHSEADWMRVAGGIVPGAVPRVLHEDQDGGWFAMEYLPPAKYPVWKSQLRDGIIEPAVASAVGRCLVRIHGATAGSADIAGRFATDHIFYPIRPEPYLVATAMLHPDLESRLQELADLTMRTHLALVHGDVSPKNILAGPAGPVFLDAECAWYGDPAFDLAFVLNHMLLKCVWRPQWTARYMACFAELTDVYRADVTWEPPAALEERAAHLLPGLLLGRVDGKSPAEYITRDADRDMIREAARRWLLDPVATLTEVGAAWTQACARRAAGANKFDMGTPSH